MKVTDLPRNMQTKITIDTASGCWVWTGAIVAAGRGYGCVCVRGKTKLTHRVAYELLVGPIPEGLVIDHVVKRGCIYTTCCNPAHLEPVTQRENVRRGAVATKTHCSRGHEYAAGDNLILTISKNGWIHRTCRICVTARRRLRWREKAA